MSDSFVTPWTVLLYMAPQSMGFSRQEYWSGLPLPSSGDLPDPGIEPVVEPASLGFLGELFTAEPTGKPLYSRRWGCGGGVPIAPASPRCSPGEQVGLTRLF